MVWVQSTLLDLLERVSHHGGEWPHCSRLLPRGADGGSEAVMVGANECMEVSVTLLEDILL